MPITAKCDSCPAQFKVKDELAGKKVKCPKCKQPFTISAGPKSKGTAGAKKKPVAKKRPKPAVDEYSLAPAPPTPSHNPMLDLLDDAGVESTPQGPVCNNCGSELSPMAIICVECGFNNESLGKQLETTTYTDPDAIDSGLSDAEKMLAKAEREIEDTPISAADQDFGDGADSFLIAIIALVVAVALAGLGIGTIFVMDRIGENINTARISLYGALSIYAFCAIWITLVAFKAKPIHGVACLFTAGVYSIIFGFMQGKALIIPTIICVVAILIGTASWLVDANTKSSMLMDAIEIVTIV